MEPEICPSCKGSLIGEPIPEDIAHLYSSTHGSIVIGIEDTSFYDGVGWWKCPLCEHVWGAFSWSPKWEEWNAP